MLRVGVITLGCDKNTVDNEYLAGLLEDAGCAVIPLPFDAIPEGVDSVVVTTCGFIGDAQRQSVETLVRLADAKRDTGSPRRIYVAGCLAQRNAGELLQAIPEIDGIVGVGQFETLANMILGIPDDAPWPNAVRKKPEIEIYRFLRRRRLDTKPYTFLKIADGCNHACTFCAIPKMKGALRSVAPDILVREAEGLVRRGARELNIVAQDISVYGADRGPDYRLPQLLRDLCRIEGDFWIRCLYCYPGGVTDELIEVMATEPKIAPYLDIPLQHLDPGVLQQMHRPHRALNALRLVERLRDAIPDIALRTTMIVGFPGETRAAHQRLLEGLGELAFDWLGAFPYSREEDTPAAVMPKQVRRDVAARRLQAVLELQVEITALRLQGRVGQRTRVLIEGRDNERGLWIGRSPHEAPEVDGMVYVASEKPLRRGDFVEVAVTGSDVYDLYAEA
jgi:ribosomal protein S12 methylthiotransferase